MSTTDTPALDAIRERYERRDLTPEEVKALYEYGAEFIDYADMALFQRGKGIMYMASHYSNSWADLRALLDALDAADARVRALEDALTKVCGEYNSLPDFPPGYEPGAYEGEDYGYWCAWKEAANIARRALDGERTP